MKIQIEETIYEGTGAEIMDQLRGRLLDPADCPDTDSYHTTYSGTPQGGIISPRWTRI